MRKRLLSILLTFCLLLGCVPVLTLPAAASTALTAAEYTLPFGTTISAGSAHMAVIKEDGTLWTWGRNEDGRLGIGMEEEIVSAPVQVRLDKKAVSVSAGTDTTSIITTDGELWNWGADNLLGALGRDVSGESVGPGKVMDSVREISSSGPHSAAITYDGTLWTWGRNNSGQLGNNRQGTITEGVHRSHIYEPLPIRAMENVRTVKAGGYETTFAVLTDGSLWAWGSNEEGALGNDSSVWDKGQHDDSLLGVTETWTEVFEEAYIWEDSTGFQLIFEPGDSIDFTSIYQPTPIKIMDGVSKVDSDVYTMILKDDGTVWICGRERKLPSGQYTYAPEQVMDGAVDVATGGQSFAAIKTDGSLWTWGHNAYGQLGQGSETWEEKPAKVLDDVVAVTAGTEFMAALKNDGTLWMWGCNEDGQIGVGSEEIDFTSPVKVMEGIALPSQGVAIPAAARSVLSTGGQSAKPAMMDIPDWAFRINGNTFAGYTFNSGNGTWDESEAYCESLGGHLATLATPEEAGIYFDVPMYIGGRRDSATGQWYWITGESCTIGTSDHPEYDCLCKQPDGLWFVSNHYSNAKGFICEWETNQTASYEVYFNANGGLVSTRSKQVTNGRTYGALPTPTWDGYSFLGWYTASSGGDQVTANSVVSLTDHQMLYAQWTNKKGGPVVADVSYSFSNNSQDFGYPNNYKIPYERYTYMFGDNQQAWDMYTRAGIWGGSCFGMVTSAANMYANNNPTPISQLPLEASNGELTVKQFIESMQISQMGGTVQKVRNEHFDAYSELVQAVLHFQQTGTQPVFIDMNGPQGRGGHTVLGLAAYRDPDSRKDIIQVYDPNFPLDNNRWIDVYWNSQGYYTGWYYHFNDSEHWGSAYGGSNCAGKITFTTYADVMSVWNNRGSETALTSSTLNVSTGSASIYDYSGNLVATIRNGEVTSNREDVFLVIDPTAGNAGSGGNGVTLWVPQEYFIVVNEDADAGKLTVTLSGGTSEVTVSTSADRALVYTDTNTNTNVALVNGRDESYEMIFRSGENSEVRLTGTTQEGTPACFAQMSGELSGMGVKNSRLSINGKAGSAGDVAQTTVVSVITSTASSNISAVFADVPGSSYYAPAVGWAYENGVTVGTELNQFSPDLTCTRAEALTFLWRALGCPEASEAVQPFADVQESDYFYQAVLWAAGSGVTDGVSETSFAPGRTCTDWEVLTFIWRALGMPGQRTDFAGYEDAAAWAEGMGLLRDTDTQPPCLRRDAVTFLYRALAW